MPSDQRRSKQDNILKNKLKKKNDTYFYHNVLALAAFIQQYSLRQVFTNFCNIYLYLHIISIHYEVTSVCFNSLKLSFTNIRGLRSNFVDCESFLESNSPDILAVWDKPGWLNWFWQFLCERLSSFNPKGF